MDNNQKKFYSQLKKYPDISKKFDLVTQAFSSGNYQEKAESMYNCLDALVNYIYSNCNASEAYSLFEKIEMLYESEFISEESYSNYLSIIDFKNKYEYAARSEEEKILKILILELKHFLSVYSSKVDMETPLGKKRFIDFLFYRLIGLMALIIGSYGIYDNIVFFFSLTGFIFSSLFAILGLLLIIAGKKTAVFWNNFRFGDDK